MTATAKLREAAAAQRDWMAELLLRLLAEPTVLGQEERGQAIVARTMRELGLEVSSVPLDADVLRAHPLAAPFDWDPAGKRNVVGDWPSPGDGRSLALSSHIDVPEPQAAELWVRPPYEPYRRGDEIVGWGILKSGLVAQLGAVRALRAAGVRLRGALRVQSVVEEETTGHGTLATALALPPVDGALVGGCLGDAVPFAQVGAMWFTVRVAVPPSHAGDGIAASAIDKALELVGPLRELARDLNDGRPDAYRDAVDPISLNVGSIHGGTLPSIGPGECELSCRISLFPGESIALRRRQVEDVVAYAASRDPLLAEAPPTVRFVGFSCEGYELERDAPIVRTLADAHARTRGREPRLVALTTALDARTFHHLGTPAASAGPVVRNLHAIDESVRIDDMVEAAEIIARFACDWCGATPTADA